MRDDRAPKPEPDPPGEPAPRVISDVDEFRVSIGIHGEELDPDRITALMRCEPDDSHRRGELRGPRSPPMPRGAWFVEGEGAAPTEPEAVLAELLSRLPPEPAIWNGLRERFQVMQKFGLFLDASRRAFELSPAIVQRVGELGIGLGFDIYGPEGSTIGGQRDADDDDHDDDEDDDDDGDNDDVADLAEDSPVASPATEPPPRRGRLIRVGGRIDRTRATLRIQGASLDPAQISRLIGAPPTPEPTAVPVAEQRGGDACASAAGAAPDVWLLSTDGESPTQPEDVLARLLAVLPADPAILARLRERHHVALHFELHLFTWNRGFDLTPAIVQRLARLGLGLCFDIHASHDPDLEPPRSYEELGWQPRSER